MIFRAAALFVAVAVVAAGAGAGDLAVPAPPGFVPGSRVAGTMIVDPFGSVAFSEILWPGGLLIGHGGPLSDPERWSWTGTWELVGDRLCRSVPTTNSVACLVVRQDTRGVTVARPAGKLGRGGTIQVEARLFPGAMALRDWTVPAAVVLALRERASP